MVRSRSPRGTAPLLVLTFLLTGAAACHGTPQITIAGGEARLSPMLVGVCAVFLRIENAGGGDALVGVRMDLPGAVAELHGMDDGRMVKQDRIPVPAKGVVELEPGGLHIMVFGLPKTAGAGTELTLHLRFERAGEKATTVRIAG